MRKLTLSLFILLALAILAAVATAATFTWRDNSDNEQGFELRGTSSQGVTTVIANTAANVETLQVANTAPYHSVQAFAWNVDWDGEKQYSDGSNVLVKPSKPTRPDNLKIGAGQTSARYNPRRGRNARR